MNKFNQIDHNFGCFYSSIIFLFYLWPLDWATYFITLSGHLKCRITNSFHLQSSATAWSGTIEVVTASGRWLSTCTLSQGLPAQSRWSASMLSLKLRCYSNSTIGLACRWIPLSLLCLHAPLGFLSLMLHLNPRFSKHLR